VLGALVAGMNAGLAHNTWPLMDGQFIPDGLIIMEPQWLNAFENAMTVQFNHRMFAYLIALWRLANLYFVWRNVGDAVRVRVASGLLVAGILLQAGLGIWTLLAHVPLWLGLAHQAGAVVVLTGAVWFAHVVFRMPVIRQTARL